MLAAQGAASATGGYWRVIRDAFGIGGGVPAGNSPASAITFELRRIRIVGETAWLPRAEQPGVLGCGWGRDRGPKVCTSTLRVARRALEERVFGAIRTAVLIPEHVEYGVERALALLHQKTGQGSHERDRRRLVQLEVEIARAIDLAVKTDGIEAVVRKLEALKAEQAEIQARLACARRRYRAFRIFDR